MRRALETIGWYLLVAAAAIGLLFAGAPPAEAAEPAPGGDVCGTASQPNCPFPDVPCFAYLDRPQHLPRPGTHGFVKVRSELTCPGTDFKRARVRNLTQQKLRRVEKRVLFGCDRCLPDCDRCVPDIWVTVDRGRMSGWSSKRSIHTQTVTGCDTSRPSRVFRQYAYIEVETGRDVLRARMVGETRRLPCHVSYDREDTL